MKLMIQGLKWSNGHSALKRMLPMNFKELTRISRKIKATAIFGIKRIGYDISRKMFKEDGSETVQH